MNALALQPTDPAFPSTAILASFDSRSEAAGILSVFCVLFSVKVMYERNVEGGFLGHVNTRSMLSNARVSFKEFEYVWDTENRSTRLPHREHCRGVTQGNI